MRTPVLTAMRNPTERLNFLNARSDDRNGIARMTEFEMHATSDVAGLKHGPAPGAALECDQYGLGAKLWMT